jgi:fatty acid desaturase
VHHDLPGVPWFALGQVYARRRDGYRASNGGFVVRGYGEWAVRHAFAQAAEPVHPFAVSEPPSGRRPSARSGDTASLAS